MRRTVLKQAAHNSSIGPRTQPAGMSSRISLNEFLVLAGLVTALTLAAALVFPVWDDGKIMLNIKEFGSDAIWAECGDRPLVASFLMFLFRHRLFLPVGIALHW